MGVRGVRGQGGWGAGEAGLDDFQTPIVCLIQFGSIRRSSISSIVPHTTLGEGNETLRR